MIMQVMGAVESRGSVDPLLPIRSNSTANSTETMDEGANRARGAVVGPLVQGKLTSYGILGPGTH